MAVAFPDQTGPFVLPGCGHFVSWEAAETLNGLLVEFFRDML